MSAVFEAVSDVVEAVGDAVGDVIDVAVDVVEEVGETVGNVVENALENPVATIATIAAVAAAPATGGASLNWIPAINAANTLAQGGDFEDALTSAAISYVAQGAGRFVGDVVGTAAQYGTDLASQQTAMLAAQSGDMLGGTFGGTVGGAAGAAAAGATAAALSGGDIDQAIVNALGNYAVRTGVNYGVNAAGRFVDQFGNEAPPEVQDQIMSEASDISYELDNMYNRSEGNILNNFGYYPSVDPYEVDNVGNRSEDQILEEMPQPFTFDPYEVDNVGNRSEDQVLAETSPAFTFDPYEVDNVGNRSEEQILTGNFPDVDPYEIDNVGNRSEENILRGYGNEPDLIGAAGKYFKNEFMDQLKNQLVGAILPKSGVSTRAPSRGVSIPGLPGISSSLSNFGFLGVPADDFSIEEAPSQASASPIKLWDPGIDSDWGPQMRLGGLGFAGRFINQDQNMEYINQQEEERHRIMEEARQRGWMTDEERAMLEQGFGAVDQNQIDSLAGASPWFSPEYAKGGHIDHNPEFYSEGGASLANRYVKGDGDGTSDSVPAMLASGEFVIPADVVSGLGNGDNDAGAKVLDEFMATVRQHKRSSKPNELPPDSEGPLSYLAKAKKRAGKNGRT